MKVRRTFSAALGLSLLAGAATASMSGSAGPSRSTSRSLESLSVEIDEAERDTSTKVSSTTPELATSTTFTLHSRPGSTKTIYLDFTGHTTADTIWNRTYTGGRAFTSAPYDKDGNPSSFSTAEHAVIQEVWKQVREDFAPFDVDVTTEDPGVEALRKTSDADAAFGIRVVISPSRPFECLTANGTPCGGVANIGSFDSAADTPAFVFTTSTSGAKFIGEAASHEVGHTLGLHHDGRNLTSGHEEYFAGHGDWAPIMGNSYSRTVTQWSRGEYAGSDNQEDDLAIITANGVSYVTDDHLGTAATTSVLKAGAPVGGIISKPGDVDAFKFTLTVPRKVTITVRSDSGPADPNLNVRAVVKTSTGTTVVTAVPTDNLGASFSVDLPAGVYVLYLDGMGEGAPASGGYSDYGSLGRYVASIAVA